MLKIFYFWLIAITYGVSYKEAWEVVWEEYSRPQNKTPILTLCKNLLKK
jgi:hypothetical protein